MVILCMEKDKMHCRGARYYIAKHNAENKDIRFCGLRSRINPELRYYASRLDEEKTDEEILAMFRQRKYRKEPYFARIG